MQVCKLLQDNNIDIPFKLIKEIGYGADGQCFLLENNQIIKFSVIFEDYKNNLEESYKYINNVLKFLIKNPRSSYVKIYKSDFLLSSFRKTVTCDQKFICYYYIMDRCFAISDDENKVFHSIISHEDRGIGFNKNFSIKQIESMLNGMSRGLDFNKSKVLDFCLDVFKAPVDHGDLHTRNIMKDQFGNFKLIDFDRSRLLEK